MVFIMGVNQNLGYIQVLWQRWAVTSDEENFFMTMDYLKHNYEEDYAPVLLAKKGVFHNDFLANIYLDSYIDDFILFYGNITDYATSGKSLQHPIIIMRSLYGPAEDNLIEYDLSKFGAPPQVYGFYIEFSTDDTLLFKPLTM